jgi:uncharacterized damage-inducible protein DinB
MEIAQVKSSLKKYLQELELVLADVSDAQLLIPEKTNKWSINQVMEHLLMANTSYLEQLQQVCMNYSPIASPEKDIKRSLTGRVFRWFVDIRTPFKVPAPSIFQPNRKQPRSVIKEDFMTFQRDLTKVCDEISDKPFNKIKISSPLSRWVTFNAGEILAIMIEHQFRHLGQIRRIKEVVFNNQPS